MTPIKTIPIITKSVIWNLDALIIIIPAPFCAATNSAATTVPQQTPIDTLAPVKISGKLFGTMTNLIICHFDAPREYAA